MPNVANGPPLSSNIGSTALRGEKLLDDEAELGTGTWTSRAEIARLLLMRRGAETLPS